MVLLRNVNMVIVDSFIKSQHSRSEMIINYQVIVERYPLPNGVVGGSIPTVTSTPPPQRTWDNYSTTRAHLPKEA